MVKKYSSQELDSIYHALSSSVRRKILARLVQEPCGVSELAQPFALSLAAISKHVRVLEKAGLLRKERRATTLICHADLGPVESAAAFVHFLEQFLRARQPRQDEEYPTRTRADTRAELETIGF